MGLQLGLNFLNSIDLTDRPQSTAHFFTDCQSAITAATVKILKIGTPEIITIIVVQLEQFDFTVQYCVQKMQTE